MIFHFEGQKRFWTLLTWIFKWLVDWLCLANAFLDALHLKFGHEIADPGSYDFERLGP